jgi:predicted permease
LKLAKGILSAAAAFLVVGVALPYLLEYFSQDISSYVRLPPADELWAVFLALGAAFAVTGFLQNAYSKGDYQWLFGRLGRGIVSIALFTYLLSLLPSSVGPAGIETSGLLYLIYLAVALSYGYLILDFYDARRSRPFKPKETDNMF